MPIALEDEVTLPDGRSGTVKGIHGDDWYSVTLAAGEEVKIQLEKMSEGGDNGAEEDASSETSDDASTKVEQKEERIRSSLLEDAPQKSESEIVEELQQSRRNKKRQADTVDIPNQDIEDKIPPKRLISILKDQVVKRNLIINTIREAYEKDVILLRNQLYAWRENKPKHMMDQRAILDAVPSTDFGGCIQFFEPANYQLRFRKCPRCSGSVELVQAELHRGKRDPTPEEIELGNKVEALEKELKLFKDGAAYLNKYCSDTTKDMELKMIDMKRQRDKAYETVEKIKLKPGYDTLQRNLERATRQYITMEKQMKKDITEEKHKGKVLQSRVDEANQGIDELQIQLSESRSQNQQITVQKEGLSKELETANNIIKEKKTEIKNLRTQTERALAKAKHAENQRDKQAGEMESSIEMLRKGFQKAQKQERKAVRARDMFQEELKQARLTHSLYVIKSTVKSWLVAEQGRAFQKWRLATTQIAVSNMGEAGIVIEKLRAEIDKLKVDVKEGTDREAVLKDKIKVTEERVSEQAKRISELLSTCTEEHRSSTQRTVEWKQKANDYENLLHAATLNAVKLGERVGLLEKALANANDPARMIRMIAAATIIQTYRRGQLARRHFDIDALSSDKRLRLMKAANAIETFAHRKEDIVHVLDIEDEMERRVMAVSIIQRHYRGYRGRLAFKNLNLDEFEEEKMVRAAVKVQLRKKKRRTFSGLQMQLQGLPADSTHAAAAAAAAAAHAAKSKERTPHSPSRLPPTGEGEEPNSAENVSDTNANEPAEEAGAEKTLALNDLEQATSPFPSPPHSPHSVHDEVHDRAQVAMVNQVHRQREQLKAAKFLQKVFRPNLQLALLKTLMLWREKTVGHRAEEKVSNLTSAHEVVVKEAKAVEEQLIVDLEKEKYGVQNAIAKGEFFKEKFEKKKGELKASEEVNSKLKTVLRQHENKIHEINEAIAERSKQLEKEKQRVSDLEKDKVELETLAKTQEQTIQAKVSAIGQLHEKAEKAKNESRQNNFKHQQSMQRIAVLTQEVDRLQKDLKFTKERVATLSTDLFKTRRIATNDAYRADVMQSTVTKINGMANCLPAEPMDGINVEKGADKITVESRLSNLSNKLSVYVENVKNYKTSVATHVQANSFTTECIVSDGLNIWPDPSRMKGNVGRKSVLDPKKMMMRRLKSPEKFHVRRPHTSDTSTRPRRVPLEATDKFPPPSNFLMERTNEKGKPQFLLAPLQTKSREGSPRGSPASLRRSSSRGGTELSPPRKMYSWME